MPGTKEIELLAPARDIDTAREAILHGADAVYIGAPKFGARKAASNSIDDIRKLIEFAHPYRARVFVTLNTILYDSELKEAERIIKELYHAGTDALIIQDMGILRMDIPPIELHASTQCHIDTPRKARFLEAAGFSRLVLARELSYTQIKEIAESVNIPVEIFVHGALCVSYSGRCHASCVLKGRSANRGECAQICRLPFTLSDANGKTIIADKHLLSLKDLNSIEDIGRLIECGATSFKIEGRLKDTAYVKNTVAAYNAAIRSYMEANPGKFRRTSSGISEIAFTPSLEKSFNRGFTRYFRSGDADGKIASIDTPKSLGERIKSISSLNNGDGISFFNKDGLFSGCLINKIEGNRIVPANRMRIPSDAAIYRTYDRKWESMLAAPTARRHIPLHISLDENGITGNTQNSCVRIPFPIKLEKSRGAKSDVLAPLKKLGNSIYYLESLDNRIPADRFIPSSTLTSMRRDLTEALTSSSLSRYPYYYRKPEDRSYPYPSDKLHFADNVSNRLAAQFYKDHGVKTIDRAIEASPDPSKRGCTVIVMTTRYCILKELGMCRKLGKLKFPEPLILYSGNISMRLEFDCSRCGMRLIHDE